MKLLCIMRNSVVTGALCLMPLAASAHQHETFRIGDKTYTFTIGSINEPVAVDDKSGVELSVALAHEETGDHADGAEHEEGEPVTGLEQTLKVEVIAGDKKKMFDLAPAYGEPGSYKAIFIPTVQTTYTYRLTGTINGTQVDIPFQCNPAGHPVTPEWTGESEMSPGVVRLVKSGAFGCPKAKEDLGFPEPAASLVSLSENGSGMSWGLAGTVLGTLGCVIGIAALVKKRA